MQSTGHQPLETRSAMAYWQNGKLYLHGSTQSVVADAWTASRAGSASSRRRSCSSASTRGGGFGSKGAGAVSMAIPALLSKKANAPVMMRISREEEHYIGRARTEHDRARARSASARTAASPRSISSSSRTTARTGRWAITAPPATPPRSSTSRRRCAGARVNVLTNTPPRTQQRSPGPMQANGIIEPVDHEGGASSSASIRSRSARINSPEGKALYRPAAARTGSAGTSPARS